MASKITMKATGDGSAHVLRDAAGESKVPIELEATIKTSADVACAIEAIEGLHEALVDERHAWEAYQHDLRDTLPGFRPSTERVADAHAAATAALSEATTRCLAAWGIVVVVGGGHPCHQAVADLIAESAS